MDATRLVTMIHGLVALAIIAAATTLLVLHDVDATTALALYGASLALVGGTTNTLLALHTPAPTPPATQPAPLEP